MSEAAGKRARRQPDLYAPPDLRPPSAFAQGALGQATALKRASARNQAAEEHYQAELGSFLTSRGFKQATFQVGEGRGTWAQRARSPAQAPVKN